jgi:P27 family predicted phage terminase small subunit
MASPANAGRTPAPPHLKLVEGRAPGRDSGGRVVPDAPAFKRLPPERPELLWGDAKEEWDRVVVELSRLDLIKEIDAAALTAYCLAYQRMCQAQRLIDEEGLLHENSQGRTRHPAVAVLEAASKELRAWCAEFGLTPAAEGKVGRRPTNGDGNEGNPYS